MMDQQKPNKNMVVSFDPTQDRGTTGMDTAEQKSEVFVCLLNSRLNSY